MLSLGTDGTGMVLGIEDLAMGEKLLDRDDNDLIVKLSSVQVALLKGAGFRSAGKAWPAAVGELCLDASWPRLIKLASIACASYDPLMDVTTVSPKYQVVIPKRVREQFGLTPGQQLQVIALPGRIELVPTLPPAALRGFLQGENTFEREPDRL